MTQRSGPPERLYSRQWVSPGRSQALGASRPSGPSWSASRDERSPPLDRHERDVVDDRAPQRKPDRVAYSDRVTNRWRRRAESRGSRRDEPTDLLVRDHQQLRVDRSHDPAALPLLLAGARAGGAPLPLALEPLHLRPGGLELPVDCFRPPAPARVAQAEADGEREVQDRKSVV